MEDFEPRPKASQTVAAAKRARLAHDDAEPIAPAQPPARQYLPFGVGALIIIVLMVLMAAYQLSSTPARPLTIPASPAAAALSSSSTAPAAPTTTPAPTTAPQWVLIAYAAPDGVPLGPVDLAGELVIAVGRAGNVWVQLQRPSGDRVWFRRADLPPNLSVPDSLPDLSPRQAQPPQTGQGLPSTSEWVPSDATSPPATGQKEAPDRAARHATAVARSQQAPHGSK